MSTIIHAILAVLHVQWLTGVWEMSQDQLVEVQQSQQPQQEVAKKKLPEKKPGKTGVGGYVTELLTKNPALRGKELFEEVAKVHKDTTYGSVSSYATYFRNAEKKKAAAIWSNWTGQK